MKTEKQIKEFLETSNTKQKEKILNIKIRNGQTTMGIKAVLKWVLE